MFYSAVWLWVDLRACLGSVSSSVQWGNNSTSFLACVEYLSGLTLKASAGKRSHFVLPFIREAGGFCVSLTGYVALQESLMSLCLGFP